MDVFKPHTLERMRTWQDYFVDFSKATVIRGFLFLIYSHDRYERLMWLIFILGTFFMAAKDCTSLIVEYLNDPMYTKLSYAKNMSINLLNDPILCIELDTFNLKSPVHFSNLNGLNKTLSSVITSFAHNTNNTELNIVAAHYIGLLSYMETPLSSSKTASKLPWYQFWESSSNQTKVIESIGVLSKLFKEDFLTLRNRVTVFLCKLIELQVISSTAINYIYPPQDLDICRPELVVWLGTCPFDSGPEEMCFRLPRSQLMFSKLLDYILVTLDSAKAYGKGNIFAEYFIFDFDGNRVVSGVREQIQTFLGEKTLVNIKTFGHYLTRPTSIRPCKKNQSDVDCMGVCRAKLFESICNCWPSNWVNIKDKKNSRLLCTEKYIKDEDFPRRMQICADKVSQLEHG